MLPFPLFSGLASILLMASFALPIIISPDLGAWLASGMKEGQGSAGNDSATLVVALASFAFYLLNYFIVVFFNTALAACAVKRLNGEDSTVAHGFRVACSRLPQIVSWVLLAASVGVFLRAVSERSALLGKIVVGLIGAAWTVAAALVVPTLVVEGLGPIAALKRSSSLIVSSWGEGLSGSAGLGLLNIAIFFVGVATVVTGLCASAATHSALIMAATFVFALLYFPLAICVSSALSQIFIVGLYLYAADHRVPDGFSPETLKSAFPAKR